MRLTSTTPGSPGPAPFQADRSELRRLALANVLRAGHCAPTVTRTLVEAAGGDASWPVKLVSGLPGGIGNSGNECGAITASLVVLGLRHARDPVEDGVPAVISRSRALLRDFQACHGSQACRDLLVFGRIPLRCMGVIRRAPERCVEFDRRRCGEALAGEQRAACAALHAHLVEKDFHCAHAVFREARGTEPVEPSLLDAGSAFVGGTAYAGLTCSALTAGVMLVGLEHGQSEHAPGRVVRAMVAMASGGHAFAGDLEAISGAMNEGHRLARWFEREFGSTQCRDIAGAEFSTMAGVRRYIELDRVSRCREVATAVARRVRSMIADPAQVP